MERVRRDGEDSDTGMFAEVTRGTVDGDRVMEVTHRRGRRNKWTAGWLAPDTEPGDRAARKLDNGGTFVPDKGRRRKWQGRERG